MSKSTADRHDGDDGDLQKQQRRLREIYDARQQVAERKQRAFELLATNQLSYELASRFFAEAVETYLVESEQVIKGCLPDDATSRDDLEADSRAQLAYEVWYEADLGKLQLVNGTRKFAGLSEYLEVDGRVTEEWQESESSYIGGGDVNTKQREHQVPIHISKRAWRVCNYFWAEVGLDYDLDDEENNEADWRYDQLMN